MNQFITKIVQKNRYLCTTIVGKARTYLVVALGSVGYRRELYSTFLGHLGMEHDEGICGSHHSKLDKKKLYNQT
jgi:hypothetical protein